MTLLLNLEYSPSLPPFRRLADALRTAILDGRLTPGQPIPSVRSLSATLKVSRSTVLRAIDDLKQQGYLETSKGSSTRVCKELPPGYAADRVQQHDLPRVVRRFGREVRLSAYGNRLMEREAAHVDWQKIDFGGAPSSLAPLKLWRRLMARQWSDLEKLELAGYTTDPFGYRPLREALARYLNRARNVQCTAQRVAVFGTKRLRLDAIARVLLNPGDAIAFEEPGYPEAAALFSALGANLLPVRVDKDGMVVERLIQEFDKDQAIKLVYVTPSHQDPTGATLSLDRRYRLLDWARENRVFIIEDDYDHEYLYGAKRLPSLQGLDAGDRVIYLSSLWKILFPAVKFGFMVVPHCLEAAIQQSKYHLERSMPVAEQMALADFIDEGHLERYIRKSQSILAVRRRALLYALSKHLRDRVIIYGTGAGTHILVRLKTGLDDRQVEECAEQANLSLLSTRPFYRGRSPGDEFMISFANVFEDTVTNSVETFGALVNQQEMVLHSEPGA